MSADKKSMSTLILLILVFLGIAAGSWYFFSNKKGMETNQLATTSEQIIDEEVMATDEAQTVDHQHGDHMHSGDTDPSIAQTGTVYDLSIKPVLGRRAVGDPNAPVQIQEFFSLTCNHCADFHAGTYQQLKEKYIDTGKVYFIFEEFPLNGPALYGSMIARCLPEERYAGFIDILLRNQESWAFGGDFKAALLQNAKLAGMSEEEFDTCFNNKDLQKDVAVNIQEASEAWKISSTPTFVFNKGEKIMSGVRPLENFDKVIEELMGETSDPALQE